MGSNESAQSEELLQHCQSETREIDFVRVVTFKSMLYIQFEISRMVFLSITQKYGKRAIGMAVYKRNTTVKRGGMKEKESRQQCKNVFV